MSERATAIVFVGVADPDWQWTPPEKLVALSRETVLDEGAEEGAEEEEAEEEEFYGVEIAGISCETFGSGYHEGCFGFGAQVLWTTGPEEVDLAALHAEAERIRAILTPEFAALGLERPQVFVAPYSG